MAQTLQLKGYQDEAADRLRQTVARLMAQFRNEQRGRQPRVVVSAPTGAGKTEIAVSIMNQSRAKGKRSIFLADRTSLVDQTCERFDKYGFDYGVLWSGHERNTDHPCLIVSSQTLEARGLGALDGPVDLIIIDECHEVRKRVVRISEQLPHAVVVGLTATPLNTAMHAFYDDIVTVRTTGELMESRDLTPLQIVPVAPKRMVGTDGVDTVGDEWDEGQLGERAKVIVGDSVAIWLKVREDAFPGLKVVPTIGFFPTVGVCEYAADMFRAAGVRAEVVSYLDSDTVTYANADGTVERVKRQTAKIRDYHRRRIEVLLCPAVLGRGFDDAGTLILIDGYPLRSSLITYIQRLGRVIRAAAGKERGILINQSGNIERLGAKLAHFWAMGVDKLPKPREKGDPKMVEDEELEDLVLEPDEESLADDMGIAVVPGEIEQSWVLDPAQLKRHIAEEERVKSGARAATYMPAPRGWTRDRIWSECCGAAKTLAYLSPQQRLRAANGAYKSMTGSWRKVKRWSPSPPTPYILEAMEHNHKVFKAEQAAIQRRREQEWERLYA